MITDTIKYGPVTIHWFGIAVALAILAGLFVSIGLAKYRHQSIEPLAGILLLGVLSGLIGARVWYFAFRHDWYSPDPGRIFAVWQGGLALHGAILGGMLALLVYTWEKNLDFWEWADICAPGLILGQAIGRVGDLLNHQAFGPPTSGSLSAIIPVQNRPPQFIDVSRFTPTAAYEGVWDVAVFLFLIALTILQRQRLRAVPIGAVFLAYLVLYSVGRIPLESQRLDSLYLGSVRVAQLASVLMLVLGIGFYALRLLPRAEPEPAAVPVIHGRVSDAYLVAATRSSRLRLGHSAQEWDDLELDDDDDAAGNGYHRDPTPILPRTAESTADPQSESSARPAEEEAI
jgi:phosphatidylglycerol:prolipoprotein diacylglycerol transferase